MTAEKPWVDGLTIGRVFTQTAGRFPDRDAIVFPRLDLRYSYAEFSEHCHKLARALVALGLEPGDHVGIWATNWPQWLVAQFGTALAGMVLVNINPAYKTTEIAYALNTADIVALLMIDSFKSSNYVNMICQVVPELGDLATSADAPQPLSAGSFPKLRHVLLVKGRRRPGMLHWDDLDQLAGQVDDDAVARRAESATCRDVVNIQFTSGTTGLPKGAMLTHRNLLLNAYYAGRAIGFSQRDRLCIPVPFYHCFGCVLGTLMNVIYGSATVSPAESFDPEATLEAIARERCTAVYGVPTMFINELASPNLETYDLGSLRTGIMAGAPCPIEVMKRVVDDMGVTEMTIAYGLTEASPVVTQTRATDSLDVRVSTVGRVIPGVEAKVMDPASGLEMSDGRPGELWARGHCVMKGYYRNEEATAAAIVDGQWLRTGDLAVRTPEGLFQITGRIKDVIIRGGENIYPRELEEFLLTHEKVRDVQVVGLPDPVFGEQASAWVLLEPGQTMTEDELKAFCKGRIAHYKVPYYVVFVTEFPMTVTGKIQKFRLREIGIEQFGLERVSG